MLTARWVRGDAPAGADVVQDGTRARRSWATYVNTWVNREVPVALRDAARASGCTTGRDLADGHFVLNDGRVLDLTTRACAALLAAMADRRESYMDHL